MRARLAFLALPVLTSVLVMAMAPASASAAGLAGHGGAARTPWRAGLLPAPSARITDNVLDGVTCTLWPDSPSTTSFCLTAGTWVEPGLVDGLLEASSNGGHWYITNTDGYQSEDPVTAPVAISCVPTPDSFPQCLAVGERYRNFRYPVELVESGEVNGFSLVTARTPKGATWSVLDDVSCATVTFCLLVGSDGTTRKTAHGLRYISHANVYRWDGSAVHRLAVPAPAHASQSELAAVSCPTATSCLAVGNYTTAAGRSLPYSALWTSGSWHVRAARTIGGKASTLFQGVSCAAAASCIAVGDAVKPGVTAFAERFSGGTWTAQHVGFEPKSALYSVSCPAAASCVAVGQHGSRSLIEAWNGSRWTVRAIAVTPAPFTTDVLQHVSCVSASICSAVGFRHNPKGRFAYHTLAAYWNGSAWAIKKSANQVG